VQQNRIGLTYPKAKNTVVVIERHPNYQYMICVYFSLVGDEGLEHKIMV
jgi:hypothetical protein